MEWQKKEEQKKGKRALKRDNILQKRPVLLRSLQIDTPFAFRFLAMGWKRKRKERKKRREE